MYGSEIDIIQDNQVLLMLLMLAGIITWWGFLKGSIVPGLLASVGITFIYVMAILILKGFCIYTGKNIEDIQSLNYPILAALVVLFLLFAAYIEYSEKSSLGGDVTLKVHL